MHTLNSVISEPTYPQKKRAIFSQSVPFAKLTNNCHLEKKFLVTRFRKQFLSSNRGESRGPQKKIGAEEKISQHTVVKQNMNNDNLMSQWDEVKIHDVTVSK